MLYFLYTAPLGSRWPDNEVDNGVFLESMALFSPWEGQGIVENVEVTPDAGNPGAGQIRLSTTASVVNQLSVGSVGSVFQVILENRQKNERIFIPRIKPRHISYNPGWWGAEYRMVLDLLASHAIHQAGGYFSYNSVGYNAGVSFSYSGNSGGFVTGPLFNNGPSSLPPAAASATGKASISDLVPGRLRGYREWKVLPGDDSGVLPRLASLTAETVWPWTPHFEARCHRAAIVLGRKTGFGPGPKHDPTDIPNVHCSCGIYAKHRPILKANQGHALGIIEAWGNIEVGSEAFRAQYARIVALYTANGEQTSYWTTMEGGHLTAYSLIPIKELGKLYRVPVFLGSREALAEYPPTDISSLTD